MTKHHVFDAKTDERLSYSFWGVRLTPASGTFDCSLGTREKEGSMRILD